MTPRSSPAPVDSSSPKSSPEKFPSSPSDRSTSSTSSFASIRKKLKKVSLKKMFKENKKSPSKNDQVNGVSPWKPKDVDDSQYDDPSTPKSLPKHLSFPSSPSDRSTSSTNSFASVRNKLKKVSLKKMFKNKKKSKEVRPWEPKDVDDTQCDGDENTPPRTILFVPESGSVETADITSPNTPLSNASCSNDVDEIIEINDSLAGTPSNGSSAGKSSPYIFSDTDDEIDLQDENNKLRSGDVVECSIESIQTKVELELSRLDEKLKTQKAERRAVAKQHFDIVAAESDGSMRSQNVGVAQTKQIGFLFLAFVLLPIVFMVHCFFLDAFVAPYSHDIAMEFAQDFFGTPLAMKGITVVVSETKSKLGSTIGHRFVELGATVTSLQDDIDCNNLDSVSTAIDSVLGKHDSIDYLVQTGNLCQDSMETMVSGRNYLSAFMLTQKILPSLEKSRHGTLVQFTSKTSALASQSMSPSTAFPGQETTNGIMTQLFYLPLSFTSAKLFETIQHRVITRAYPNVRSLEISRGWIGLGETGANDFFHRIFQEDDDASAFSSFEDEDLQENIYEWSQDTVWKWVAPPSPSPVAEMIVGSPPSRQAVALSEQKRRSASVAKSSYFPTSVTTVVTTGALALLAMKAKEFSWDSGASWLQSK